MDYEKAYKTALERAKKWYYAPNADKIPTYANRVIEEIFPELQESEDEKIKEILIDYFKTYKKQEECGIKTFFGIPTDNIIAWLEKQGEKKVPSVDFKAKDCYVSEVDGNIHNMTYDAADKVEPKNMEDETEIPFDANDSELTEVTYDIPKGFHAEIDDDKVVIKIGEKKPIMDVPTREVILAIWDLGNEWKELTNGRISEKYGTQLDYIQKHWLGKQGEKKATDKSEYVYILDYCSGRVIIAKHDLVEPISELFEQLGLKENQCNYMTSSNILSIEYINF